MATRLTKDSDATDATRQHNAKARKDAISESLEQMYLLDKQIAAAIEKYVKPLRDSKNDAKKRLREDYELPNDVISARYASFKIERKATDEGDDKTLDEIREAFEALPIGGMVDLVNIANRASSAE